MDNDRDVLLVAIFTFFTVFAWIFFELVQTTRTTTISSATNQLLKPLEAKLDTQTLNMLEQRKEFK